MEVAALTSLHDRATARVVYMVAELKDCWGAYYSVVGVPAKVQQYVSSGSRLVFVGIRKERFFVDDVSQEERKCEVTKARDPAEFPVRN